MRTTASLILFFRLILDNKVFLGARNGHLLMYVVKENGDGIDYELIKNDNTFSSEPITQIYVVAKHKLLFSLTNGFIKIHKITEVGQSFEHVHTSDFIIGASLFSFKENEPAGQYSCGVRLCVVIEKKLIFCDLKQNKLQQYRPHIEFNDTPKCVVWTENVVCVGFPKYFELYDVRTRMLFAIFRTKDYLLLLLFNI